MHWYCTNYRLNKLICRTNSFQTIAAFIAVAAAAPLEDTLEVAAAKAEFQAAFKSAAAGEHAALAPVNNDLQAEQIANAYLDDDEDVATVKACCQASTCSCSSHSRT